MNIIGISAFYHESACCLIQDVNLVAAAAEERFTRVKHDPRLPVEAFRFCLRQGGIDIMDIDRLAYYELPERKLERQLWAGVPDGADQDLAWLDPHQPMRAIRERLGYEGPVDFHPHHQSHAAAAYFFSGFPHAAILTVDGVGEWATTSYGRGSGSAMELMEEVRFPHSLGLLYAAVTSYLGFRVNDGEYKVMGLAPYGKPRFLKQLRELVISESGGGFRLDMKYFDFLKGPRMFSPAFCDLFGAPPRARGAKLEALHMDLAKSLQIRLEEIILEKVRYLAGLVDSPFLCMAGGVALNCVANGRIAREGPFDKLFVQPAAGDDGGCLGAAALSYLKETENQEIKPMRHVYLGPSYQTETIAALLAESPIQYLDFRGKQEELLEAVVDRLERRKVVGWFHGRMEFGPRALGARSILANPLDPGIRDRLNHAVKKREGFRPFAPSVLWERARQHFQLDHPSPYMLQTCQVHSELDLPGITHVDGSARPQTVEGDHLPRFHRLLVQFHQRTGCPLLVNTSMNVRGEPMVNSPVDALLCLGHSGMDSLVLEDFVIDRAMLPEGFEALVEAWELKTRQPHTQGRSAIRENLYTFV